MSKVIIFPNETGIAIVNPNWNNKKEDESEEEFLTRVRNGAVPIGSPYIVAAVTDLPTDRKDRDSWRVDFTGAPIHGAN